MAGKERDRLPAPRSEAGKSVFLRVLQDFSGFVRNRIFRFSLFVLFFLLFSALHLDEDACDDQDEAEKGVDVERLF